MTNLQMKRAKSIISVHYKLKHTKLTDKQVYEEIKSLVWHEENLALRDDHTYLKSSLEIALKVSNLKEVL
jgi:hypothetical protein